MKGKFISLYKVDKNVVKSKLRALKVEHFDVTKYCEKFNSTIS